MTTLRESSSNQVQDIPFDHYKKTFLYLVAEHNVVIVVGATGCGKSSGIPRILYNSGHNQICITQPRRVAVIRLAQRVAMDLGCEVGTTVGYSIRFQDKTNFNKTVIKFLTEGILLREMMIDPELCRYSIIVIDEVHERNSYTDVLLGLLKCLIAKRTDLKLILCSATVDVDRMYNFFLQETLKPPAVLPVEGKGHSVKIYHIEKPCANYVEAAVDTAIKIHESARLASGNILIFLTGLDEVVHVCDRLIDYARIITSRLDLKKLSISPFHSSLAQDQIAKVFNNTGRSTRSCVVSTNVAETSLTIPDIKFVIDSGYAKFRVFNHTTCIDSLVKIPISKSCARQRAGRAGRTRSGLVFRLYSESELAKLPDQTIPELLRCSLTETVMLLKAFGVENICKFPLPSKLPRSHLIQALELLSALRAIDESGTLTPLGEKMAIMNLEPMLSKVLVDQEAATCSFELCRIIAMLQVQDVYTKSRKYANSLWSNVDLIKLCSAEGDLLSYFNILNSFQINGRSLRWAEKRNLDYNSLLSALEVAEKLEQQLRRIGIKIASCKGNVKVLQQALARGLFCNAAYLHPCGEYKTIRGEKTVHMHPCSVYSEVIEQPKFVLFVEVLSTSKCFMRHVMSIDRASLIDAAPHFYTFATSLEMMRNKT